MKNVISNYYYVILRLFLGVIGFLYGFIAETYYHIFFYIISGIFIFCLYKEYLYLYSVRRYHYSGNIYSNSRYLDMFGISDISRERLLKDNNTCIGWKCKFDCINCRYNMYSIVLGVCIGILFAVSIIEK